MSNSEAVAYELHGSSSRSRQVPEYERQRNRPKGAIARREGRSRRDLDESQDTPEIKHSVDREVAKDNKKRGSHYTSGQTRHKHQRTRSTGALLGTSEHETPITAALRDLRDDIQDSTSEVSPDYDHHFPHGDQDFHNTPERSGRVYVEHLGGFTPLSREQALGTLTRTNAESASIWRWQSEVCTALEVAISTQRLWLPFSDFCHGLLAGLAVMQAIVVNQILDSAPESALKFVLIYSQFSLIYTTVFYFLIALCLVSVFDRLDLARGDWPYLLDLVSVRPRLPWLLVPLYLCGLILTLAAARSDDWIYLSQFNLPMNGTTQNISTDELEKLQSWHVLNTLRCLCVVLGWLVMAMCHPKDHLLSHLSSMLCFQNKNSQPSQARRSF